MSDNPLPQLREYGQSLWLEDLTREILRDGTLARRVAEDGLAGVRPDPNRLQEAIACGDCYDERIAELAREGRSPAEIHETLVLEDVQAAADLLRPVYEDSDGEDGFVSFGVSPHLARDPEGTVEQAQALLVRIRRPNVLIEIPGTPEALPAIETGLTEGIQVNATLLFSVDRYRRVLDAWLRSIETRRDRGEPLGVRSVASFSLGPLDAKVDALLDECKTGCEDSSGTEQLRGPPTASRRSCWPRRSDAGPPSPKREPCPRSCSGPALFPVTRETPAIWKT
jgi:transaldolase